MAAIKAAIPAKQLLLYNMKNMLGTRNFCLVEATSSHWREWCRLEHKDGMNAALLVECQGRHQAAISKGAREISAAEEEAARVIREANAKRRVRAKSRSV